MNAPLTSIQIRLRLDGALQAAVQSLDDESYSRFRLACQFAEDILGRSAHVFDGTPKYLISHEGILLSVAFDRRREQFIVVGFEDLGEIPDPPDGVALSKSLLAQLLTLVGMDVSQLILTAASDGSRLATNEGVWRDATPFRAPTGAPSVAPLPTFAIHCDIEDSSTMGVDMPAIAAFRMSGRRIFRMSFRTDTCVTCLIGDDGDLVVPRPSGSFTDP